jgi:hypothetical protein
MANSDHVWFGLAVDIVEEQVIVAAISQTKEEALQQARERTSPDHFLAAFDMLSLEAGHQMSTWLRTLRIPAEEADKLVREFGRQTAELMEKDEQIGPMLRQP